MACTLLSCLECCSQVPQSAIGSKPTFSIGAEYSNFRPDWNFVRLPGIGIYAEWRHARYGFDGEGRFLTLTKPLGLTERSYLVGPFFTAYTRGRIAASAKFLIGEGQVHYTQHLRPGSYLEYAPGGNIDYKLSRRFTARFDYEYQIMPHAPDLPGIPTRGLTPSGFSGGISYTIK